MDFQLRGDTSVVDGDGHDTGVDYVSDRTPSYVAERRPFPKNGPHVIVFANEKGGVGKTTAAFLTCIALCNAAETVLAVDLDHRQQSLGRALENREGTGRRLRINFPSPRHVVLNHLTAAGLSQEINRLGSNCSFVVIDVAGHDSPIARHAIAMADTLVTPVNDSFVDLDVLGRLEQSSDRLKALGVFTLTVQQLGKARVASGETPTDWIVVQNRQRRLGATNEERVSETLKKLSKAAGFRLTNGLGERVIYRELFPLGLTLSDLKLIPEFVRVQPVAKIELMGLLSALKLPTRVPF
jgi:chromosome partitioning protein